MTKIFKGGRKACLGAVAASLLLGAIRAAADTASPPVTEAEPKKLELFCLLIEPNDLQEVTQAIPGAQHTVLVPGRETSIGTVRYYRKTEFEQMGLGWNGFEQKARAAASRVFATLKPVITRDRHGFATLAEVRGTSHLTASSILAPEFYEHFRKLMGDELVLLIPDRFTIYVFPRPLGEYKDWGKKILHAYADAAHPVSYEVLLLNRDGLSALGVFQKD